MNDADNLLKEGIAAVKAGQRARARALLQRVLRQCPNDATTWLWLSGAVETDDERRECLENALAIDPNNPHALKGLQKLGPRVIPTPKPPTPAQVAAEKSPTPTSAITDERHHDLLQREIQWYTNHGWQLAFQSETAIQVRKGKELKYITVEQIEQRIAEAQAEVSSGVGPRSQAKRAKRLRSRRWMTIAFAVVLLCGCAFALSLATRAPTSTSSPTKTPTATKVQRWEGVFIGMPADDVLRIHPKSEMTEDSVVLRSDSKGLIARWSYPGAYLIFARREGAGTDDLGMVECYRVIEIQLR